MASLRMNDSATSNVSVEIAGIKYILEQDPNSHNHGLVLWDASIAMCRYFEHKGLLSSFRGLRVLEIGCGTGLLSMVMAAAGAEVVCTDLADVIPLAQRNYRSNASPTWGKMTVMPYCWGDDMQPVMEAGGGYFDMILGTDVAYSEALNRVLLQSAANIAHASEAAMKVAATAAASGAGASGAGHSRRKRCTVMFANEFRCAKAQAVFDEHAARLFDLKLVPSKNLHPDWRPLPSSDDGGPAMLIFECRVKLEKAKEGAGSKDGKGTEA